jgi:DNA replication protein DnaC
LSGKTGVGKTFASKCVASALATKGLSVCFVSAFQMNELFLKYHTTFDASKSSVLSPLTDCDALFVDDLGTEPMLSNVTINYLYLILSERERFGRATVITTNLTPENILNQYGERICSRLFSKGTSVRFEIKGDDLRV